MLWIRLKRPLKDYIYFMRSPAPNNRKSPTPGRVTNIPKIWNGLIYSELLNDFTREIEMAYESMGHLQHSEQIKGARRLLTASAPSSRDERGVNNSNTKKSQLFKAFKAGRSLVEQLTKNNPNLATSAKKVKESAATFHSAQNACVHQLGVLLPHADDTGHMTWPPPVPAHLAINAFVSLSLRIHTERPTLPPKAVMRVAASKTLVPVLAHWLCVSGISGRANFHGIKALKNAFEGVAPPPLHRDDPDTLLNELAWLRVAKVLAAAAKRAFGKEAQDLLAEVIALIENHVENPHGGRLWSIMGKLNGTPPGANLLVVFECLNEIEEGHDKNLGQKSHDSTYYCSRIRYEAVRLGHYDEDFKSKVAKGINAIEQAIKDAASQPLEKKLSMAFILSRRALLNADDDAASIKAKTVIAKMTCALLEEVADSRSARAGLKEIATRYLLGFQTNPRFVKYIPDFTDFEKRLNNYQEEAAETGQAVPLLLSKVFQARLQWAKSLAGEAVDTSKNVLAPYARCAEELFQAIEDGKGGDACESEAPIWILPELAVLVWLGDDFGLRITTEKRLALSTEKMTADQRKLENAYTILTRIAETEFGIYYHHATERKRIIEGMLRFADLVKAARQRS